MDKEELDICRSHRRLNKQACFAVTDEEELENHQSQGHQHEQVRLQEVRQSVQNNSGEVMSLRMVSIPSAAQLANHDQDPTKALLMWHKNHYPRLQDLIDILDAEPRSAPGDPPTQAEENLARALEELKITPRIEDNIQRGIRPYMIKRHAYLDAVHVACHAFCHWYQLWDFHTSLMICRSFLLMTYLPLSSSQRKRSRNGMSCQYSSST
jgi:hypothetical protein